MKVKIFTYIKELDCFIVNQEYKKIADKIGLTEWNEVVWIGRYFTLDNDYGEHWFDNWEESDKIEKEAKKLGYSSDDLLVIDPERLKNGIDGPCHTENQRKNFWTDVLTSLELSYETLFEEAEKLNMERKETEEEGYVENLKEIFLEIQKNCS
jgi:hypothetical protein